MEEIELQIKALTNVYVNGVRLGSCDTIYVNGVSIQFLTVNGKTVWERGCIYKWQTGVSDNIEFYWCGDRQYHGYGMKSDTTGAMVRGNPYDGGVQTGNPIAPTTGGLGSGTSTLSSGSSLMQFVSDATFWARQFDPCNTQQNPHYFDGGTGLFNGESLCEFCASASCSIGGFETSGDQIRWYAALQDNDCGTSPRYYGQWLYLRQA